MPERLSEYEHSDILIFVIFCCRKSNMKAEHNKRRKCLTAWLICTAIFLILMSLVALIVSIYTLIIVTNMLTITTGKNRVFFGVESLFIYWKEYRNAAREKSVIILIFSVVLKSTLILDCRAMLWYTIYYKSQNSRLFCQSWFSSNSNKRLLNRSSPQRSNILFWYPFRWHDMNLLLKDASSFTKLIKKQHF